MTGPDIRLACLIPARGGSKRFPRKNVAPLRGKPLIAHTIEAAAASKLFPEIWVSTDDAEISQAAKASGARIHQRPPELAGDTARLADVCLGFADWLAHQGTEIDTLCLVLPTAVLMTPDDLRGGWALMQERGAEVCQAVTSYMEPPFWALEEKEGFLKLFFGDQYLVASQKLPPVWVDSGYFYFLKLDALRREKRLFSPKTAGYKIPRERSVDIDEPGHLVIAEALMEALARSEGVAK